MAAVDDKIAATTFTVPTTLTVEQVRAAAEKAAKQADGVADRWAVGTVDGGSMQFVLRRAKMAPIGSCVVTFSSAEDGTSTVTFRPGKYVRSRPTYLFIPMGPWGSTALKPMTRFSAALRSQVVGGA